MKKIKEIFFSVLGAVLVGYISGKYFYHTYSDNMYHNLSSSKLYLIENGEYESIENMRENNNYNNYIYYVDNNKYKTVVGITNNYNHIDKIKSLYPDKLEVTEYYINIDTLNDKQKEYENMLETANTKSEVKEAVDNILNLYRTDENIRLIAIN